jgi:hypothetical protein
VSNILHVPVILIECIEWESLDPMRVHKYITIAMSLESMEYYYFYVEPNLKWLVIGIPTVSRPNNEDYLPRALATLARQIPTSSDSLLYGNILVAVVNVGGAVDHARYREARDLYKDNPHFMFDELSDSEIYPDAKPGTDANNDLGKES